MCRYFDLFIFEKDPIEGDFVDETDCHCCNGHYEEDCHLMLHGCQNLVLRADQLAKEIEKVAIADDNTKTHQRIEDLAGNYHGSQAVPTLSLLRNMIPNAEVDTCRTNNC